MVEAETVAGVLIAVISAAATVLVGRYARKSSSETALTEQFRAFVEAQKVELDRLRDEVAELRKEVDTLRQVNDELWDSYSRQKRLLKVAIEYLRQLLVLEKAEGVRFPDMPQDLLKLVGESGG